MGTYGDYDRLVDILNEEFEEYSDGLECSEWISQNGDWIINMFNKVGVFPNIKLLTELYEKIQEEDWRSGSCGGCI